MSNNRKEKKNEMDEVEKLLEAAQGELALKLSVDSHMSRISPDYLHPDLHRRFQVLKSRPSDPPQPPPSLSSKQQQQSQVTVNVDEELKGVLGDDLSARFAALKASSSSSDCVRVGPKNSLPQRLDPGIRDDDEEDEVDKVIRWAMDAARLDPSPPSDEDDDHDDDISDDDDEDHNEGHHYRK